MRSMHSRSDIAEDPDERHGRPSRPLGRDIDGEEAASEVTSPLMEKP